MLEVVIQAAHSEQQEYLKQIVDNSGYGRTVLGLSRLPSEGVSELEQQLKQLNPQVVIVDIPAGRSAPAIGIIELLHLEMPQLAIFAVGDVSNYETLIAAMRAGAREYIGQPASSESVARALARLDSSPTSSPDGKIISVLNSKGGCGATTIAVNLATALTEHGRTVLVDMAAIGMTALHFNVKPKYTIRDLLESLERLDGTLMESFITETPVGVDLLGGTESPLNPEVAAHEIYAFLNLLSSRYDYVVVDLSWRLDTLVRAVCALSDSVLLTCEADVVSLLWNLGRVQHYLGETPGSGKIQLVLNRWHGQARYTDADAEAAGDAKLICKIPSDARKIGQALDKGTPVVLQQKNSEIAHRFRELATCMASRDPVLSTGAPIAVRGELQSC